ncbi:WD repeat-containing protein 76 [Chionoecetes opilio]|uniref:WD repeat-containing protein 76 n=1 Tax=Chionoecetes opilio TaxID=41210 RepID=A0A8J4XRR7_CHIOP|nr:WD repeat-containing protein 76 [Chionoecetes opilio]
MPGTEAAAAAPRRSSRVLQPCNKRILSSPKKPAKKRVKEEDLEMLLKEEIKDEEVEEEVATNGENASPTTTGPVLSEYEQRVQRNIAERKRLLETLGVLKAKEELSSFEESLKKKKTVYRGIIKEKKSPEPVIRRRSLRQQCLTPDGLDAPLPSEYQVERSERRAATPSYEEDHPKPPPGPAPLMDYYHAPNKVECEGMWRDVAKASSTTSATASSMDVWGGSAESVLERMKKLRIEEERVVKVVPNRIFSVQFHPSVEKTLVLVGGKWGELGVWDVGRQDDSSGAYCFHPHSRPINCLSVAPSSPHHAHSTSYDGSLRQTDLEAGLVQEIYALDDNQRNSFLCWHARLDANTFVLGASLGRVMQVDARVRGGRVKQLLVHERKTVKVISGHPHHHHYFATGSNDGHVSLWDLRSHKNNKSLSSVVHGRNVSGLEFSQTGNALVSTSRDDYLRFITFDGTALSGIEVWGSDGVLRHHFDGPALGSVSSVVALHPFRPALAGCNSSGKVHVFL